MHSAIGSVSHCSLLALKDHIQHVIKMAVMSINADCLTERKTHLDVGSSAGVIFLTEADI